MEPFEGALSEIRAIIEKLEGGNLSIEESLALFEKGVELINFCHKKLGEVQKRVEILIEGAGGEVLSKRFDLED
jgi:exodeoxyribonuclease VII small subunit